MIIDFEAEYVSREVSLFTPIWRANLTYEQAHKLLLDLMRELEWEE